MYTSPTPRRRRDSKPSIIKSKSFFSALLRIRNTYVYSKTETNPSFSQWRGWIMSRTLIHLLNGMFPEDLSAINLTKSISSAFFPRFRDQPNLSTSWNFITFLFSTGSSTTPTASLKTSCFTQRF